MVRAKEYAMKNPNTPADKFKKPTPWNIFLTLARIVFITLGGGYAIVPAIGNAFEKKGWIQEKEFYRIFARAQVFPGPIALSTSFLSAYHIAGIRGCVAAVFGVVLPPFIALVVVGIFIRNVGQSNLFQRFLRGAGAVVPGLVASMLYRAARNRKWSVRAVIEVTALAVLLSVFPSLAFYILIAGIALIYAERSIWKS